MAKIDGSLFSSDQKVSADAIFEAYGDCPDCSNPLQIRYANKSAFLGCTTYPACEYKKSLTDNSITTIKVMVDTPCPQCDQTLAIKKGRYGLFVGCVDFPTCNFIGSIKQQTDTKVTCPQCHTGQLLEKTNKYGKKFYSCNAYPNCKFVLNDKPVARACPECQSSIMIESSATQLHCVKPTCHGVVNNDNHSSRRA